MSNPAQPQSYLLPEKWFADELTVAVASSGRVKYWTGSAWVVKPSKYWDGGSWISKTTKYWNGSSWIS